MYSGIIMSGNIADSPVMEEMDGNQGLMIIHDASYKHYLTIYFSLFSGAFSYAMKYSYNFYFHAVLLSFVM